MNEGLTGLEQHEGFHFWVNYLFNDCLFKNWENIELHFCHVVERVQIIFLYKFKAVIH